MAKSQGAAVEVGRSGAIPAVKQASVWAAKCLVEFDQAQVRRRQRRCREEPFAAAAAPMPSSCGATPAVSVPAPATVRGAQPAGTFHWR